MKVQSWAIGRLKPYDQNPRENLKAVASVKRSIEDFGWRQPIVVDAQGVVIVGHTRLLVAQELGLKKVPVHVAELTPDEARAYRLADNRTHEDSEWNEELLVAELVAMKASGVDLGSTGFNEKELDRLLLSAIGEDRGDDDFDPEPPARPTSKPGTVYKLGPHRLMCGDSTKRKHVEKLLAGATPHLMVTDPPYGVEYDASWRNDAVQAGNGERGAPSGRAVGKVFNDDTSDWREAWNLFPGEVAYVWHASLYASDVGNGLAAAGFLLRSQIVWAKNNIAISRGHYHWQHETCFDAVRRGATAHWGGGRKQSTLWQIDKPKKSDTGHSTQKPIECMRRPIFNNSTVGDAVYDPFLGSGTTLIAAEQTGRICYGMELDPGYCDVIRRRYAEFADQPKLAP